ncbi:phage tail spike protein [Clostridium tyrobutyricum]|uniref:phage tail spike protein n=1 Tax=Clostridium tyrobutyricum TaxID=1519 RepID=UPI001C38C30B|nr:phage tail spike protein [Clostridium tyrobutyricum]MBV4423669.1 phage tail protein [Clostridium tyrobutyricum]
MYKITLINGTTETVIHYPDPEAPKVVEPKLNMKRSQAGSLNFTIYPNNPGYDLINRFTTKVKVTDARTNEDIFTGRIFTFTKGMSDGGLVTKEVVCEGAMNYLNDTRVGSEIYEDKTPQEVITEFLNAHNNSGIEDYKKVYPGTINVEDWLFFTSDFETTLEAIQKYVYNENKGTLLYRTENGVNYLDYLSTPPQDKIVNVNLGENLKSLSVDDSSVFGTRIIPVGANGLTIENVNGGKNYLEDPVARSKYGVIYQKADYSDVEDDEQLKTECQADLSQYTQPTGSLEMSVLDLSTLSGIPMDSIDISTSVHIVCPLLGVDDTYKVVEMDVDLTQPWNPSLTLSNKPSSIESSINDIQSDNITRMATYGGVQLGYRFGIRVVSHDKSVEILINGQEGFRITKDGIQKFYIDTDGNLVMDGVQKITKNGKKIIENTENDYGGLFLINDINGNPVMKIGVEAGTSQNVGATLIGYNKDSNKPRFKLGIARNGDFGAFELLNSSGQVSAVLNADDGNGNGIGGLREDGAMNKIATQVWTMQYVSEQIANIPSGGDTSGD